jgi:hypothetical protein
MSETKATDTTAGPACHGREIKAAIGAVKIVCAIAGVPVSGVKS